MEQLPFYIPAIFIVTLLLTAWLFFKATRFSKPVIILSFAWIGLHGVLAATGFYTDPAAIPPRLLWALFPPVAGIALLMATKKGRFFLDGMDYSTLTLLHIVRIPVEIVLFLLFMHKTIPGIMTFEGRNFDIIAGITAPVIYYAGFVKRRLPIPVLIAWNIICFLLLLNIVITAVLSTPSPLQQMAFDQPNIAILHFPFTWLAAFIVPVVMLSHMALLRQLFLGGQKSLPARLQKTASFKSSII